MDLQKDSDRWKDHSIGSLFQMLHEAHTEVIGCDVPEEVIDGVVVYCSSLEGEILARIKQMSDALKLNDRAFIAHIQAHLEPGQEVVCKICGQTAREICANAKVREQMDQTLPHGTLDLDEVGSLDFGLNQSHMNDMAAVYDQAQRRHKHLNLVTVDADAVARFPQGSTLSVHVDTIEAGRGLMGKIERRRP